MAGVVSTAQRARKPSSANGHGGKREGAGRKRRLHKDPLHGRRSPLSSKHPVHVSLCTRPGARRLRQRRVYEQIRRVLVRYLDGAQFRIVHISIQQNHLHLIVEATSKRDLTRGMQSFAINAARGINRAFARKGKVFAFRYNAKQIKTDRYARNAIAYVLNNWRRHTEDFDGARQLDAEIDEFSSAMSFTGWAVRVRFKPPPDYVPLPVSPPKTALLSSRWQLFGLIDPWERPGPPW